MRGTARDGSGSGGGASSNSSAAGDLFFALIFWCAFVAPGLAGCVCWDISGAVSDARGGRIVRVDGLDELKLCSFFSFRR
jgi:hypothetical protein